MVTLYIFLYLENIILEISSFYKGIGYNLLPLALYSMGRGQCFIGKELVFPISIVIKELIARMRA